MPYMLCSSHIWHDSSEIILDALLYTLPPSPDIESAKEGLFISAAETISYHIFGGLFSHPDTP